MSGDDPAFDSSHSVTQFIERLKQNDPEAAGEIWQRFFDRLLPLARARLRGLKDRTVDAEDVLVSVFDRFFKKAGENRFEKLDDRDDLLQLLLMLTRRRVAKQYRWARAEKRGGDRVLRFGDLAEPDQEVRELTDDTFGSQYLAALGDQLVHALELLPDDKTREVALLRMEDNKTREIAERLEIGLSTVERKLRVIRELWNEEFEA